MKKLITLLLLVSATVNGQILFKSDLPTGGLIQGGKLRNQQNETFTNVNSSHCMAIVDSPGYSAYRSEVRLEDPLVGGKHRSEIGTTRNSALANATYWYGQSFQVPAWLSNIPQRESHFQINDSSSATDVSGFGTRISFTRQGNKYVLINMYSADGVSISLRQYDVALDTPGVKTNWVLHYFPSIGQDGLIQLYRNGVQVYFTNGKDQNNKPLPSTYDIEGSNCRALILPGGTLYADKKMYWKGGLYCFGISDTGPKFVKRVLYVSNIVFGGINSTIADFSVTMPPAPKP